MEESQNLAALEQPVKNQDKMGVRSDEQVRGSQAWTRVDEPAIFDENEWQRFNWIPLSSSCTRSQISRRGAAQPHSLAPRRCGSQAQNSVSSH